MKRKTLFAMFLFFLSAYLVTFRGHYGSDQFMSYLTAESLVLDHNLAIGERDFAIPDIQAGYERAPMGLDGRRYTLFSLALPLVMTPFYFVGHLVSGLFPANLHDYITMFFVSMTNAFITALTCTLLARYAARLGYAPRTAFGLALLYGFGTMAWSYSQYSFAEPLLTFLFLLALSALDNWEKTDRGAWRSAIVLGVSLGLCLLTEVYAALIIVPAILIYLAVRIWQKRLSAGSLIVTALSIGTPLLIISGVLLYWYYLRFGALAAPRLSGQLSLAFIPVALYGLTVSSGKSFFLYALPAVLALGGLISFYRRQRGLSLLLTAIAMLCVLFISTYVDFWHGDAAWGPRFLFPLTFIAILPIGIVLEQTAARRAWLRWGVVAVIVTSLIIQIGGILINVGNYIRMVEDNHLGDYHFVPYLSAISGHWILVASTLYRGLTGQSLVVAYPTGRFNPTWQLVDLTGYDGFDLWFVHLPQYWHHPAAPWLAAFGVFILLISAAMLFRYIWRALPPYSAPARSL
jgi:hypothetical protein